MTYPWRLSKHEWTARCNCTFIFQIHIIQLTVPIALLFTFFLPQRIIMFLFFFYYLFAIFIYKYVAYIEKRFQVINEKQTTRLFPDESGQFFIHLKNGANIPLVNGVCYFHLNSSLIPHKDRGLNRYQKRYFLSHFHNLLIQRKNGI